MAGFCAWDCGVPLRDGEDRGGVDGGGSGVFVSGSDCVGLGFRRAGHLPQVWFFPGTKWSLRREICRPQVYRQIQVDWPWGVFSPGSITVRDPKG